MASEFLDFCEAHRGAPEQRIIADALRAFIDERLDAEPELKKRFDAARKKRLGEEEKPIRLIKNDDKEPSA